MEQMRKAALLDYYGCATASAGVHIHGGLVGMRSLRFFGGPESDIQSLSAVLALLGGGGNVLRAKWAFLGSRGYCEWLRSVLRHSGNLQYRNKCLKWWWAGRSDVAICLPVAPALGNDETIEGDLAAPVECVELLGGNGADGLVGRVSVMVVH